MKGLTLHRKSGMLLVYAMLIMCAGGMVVALGKGGAWSWINFRAAVLTAYLVTTALTTVRPLASGSAWLNVGGMLVALSVGLISLTFGFEAIANGGRRDGVPAFPFFLFGIVGLLGCAGDLIAAMSFFFGQAKVIPKPIRIPALLALPVLAVLVTMLYWLWRVRIKQSFKSVVFLRVSEAA